MPDKQYKMPDKSERRDATPANRHDAVDDTPSGKLLNVRRTWSHEMCESSPDTPGLVQQAQILPTEEPSDATISRPYPLTGCQSVIANTVTPGKVQRNPTNKSASIERLIQQNRRGIQFGHLRISRGNRTLTTLSRHPVRICMLSPRPIFKRHRKLAQQQIPELVHGGKPLLVTQQPQRGHQSTKMNTHL